LTPEEGGCTVMIQLFELGKKIFAQVLSEKRKTDEIIARQEKSLCIRNPLHDIVAKYEKHPNFKYEQSMARKLLSIWSNGWKNVLKEKDTKQHSYRTYFDRIMEGRSLTDEELFGELFHAIFRFGWPQKDIKDDRFEGVKLHEYPQLSEELFVRTAAWVSVEKPNKISAFPFVVTDYICAILTSMQQNTHSRGRQFLAPVTNTLRSMT
jgi:hypothetical protein